MPQQVEINGFTYQIGKMNAITQFHVVRRLAPLIQGLGAVMEELKGVTDAEEAMVKFFQPVADAVASMNDADAEYVLFACLGAVSRMDNGKLARVYSGAGKMLQYQDIGLDVMIKLVIAVLQDNLGNFIPGVAPSGPASAPTAS